MTNRISVSMVETGKQAQKVGCEEGDCIVELCGDRNVYTFDDLRRINLASGRSEFDFIFYSKTRDSLYKTKLVIGTAGMMMKSSVVGDMVEERIQKRLAEHDLSLKREQNSREEIEKEASVSDAGVDGANLEVTVSDEPLLVTPDNQSEDHTPKALTHSTLEQANDPIIVEEDLGSDLSVSVKSDPIAEETTETKQYQTEPQTYQVSNHVGKESTVEMSENEIVGDHDSPNECSSDVGLIPVEKREFTETVPVLPGENPAEKSMDLDPEIVRLAELADCPDQEEQPEHNDRKPAVSLDEEVKEDHLGINIEDSSDWPDSKEAEDLLQGLEGLVSLGEQQSSGRQADFVKPVEPLESDIAEGTGSKNEIEVEGVDDEEPSRDFADVLGFEDKTPGQQSENLEGTFRSDSGQQNVSEVETPEPGGKEAHLKTKAESDPLIVDENEDPVVAREVREFLIKTGQSAQETVASHVSLVSVFSSDASFEESDENADLLDLSAPSTIFAGQTADEAMKSTGNTCLSNSLENESGDVRQAAKDVDSSRGLGNEADAPGEIGDSYSLVSQLIYEPNIPMIAGSFYQDDASGPHKFLSVVQVCVRGEEGQEVFVRALQHFEKAAVEAGASAVVDVRQQLCLVPGKAPMEVLVSMTGTAVKRF